MKLSILITAYNRPEMLRRCLESIERQTSPDWEVLVADDNSAGTVIPLLVQSFSQRVSQRVFYYKSDVTEEDRPKTTRYSVLFNTIAQYAEGDVMFYLADDNEMLPHAVQTILRAFENKQVGLAYMGQVMIDVDFRTGERTSDRWDVRSNFEYGAPLHRAFCIVDFAQVAHVREFFLPWPEDGNHWKHADGLHYDELIERYGPMSPIGDVLNDPLIIYKITDTSVCRQDIDTALGKLRVAGEQWT